MIGFVLWLVVGGIAGYIAERLMKEDHPLHINIVLGVAGSVLGNSVLLFVLGLSGGNYIAQLLTGVVGACALIWGWREIEKRRA